MNFEGKRIIVTGAAGFIGSHLTEELLEKGAEVVGIDNLYSGNIEYLHGVVENPKFKFHKGDIRDLNLLLKLFEDIDIIYHLAAFISISQSIKMPELCNDINVNGTLNILNAARKKNVEKIIYPSSASVYGDTPILPKREDTLREPISPYGVSKLACEAYMLSYYHVYGLKTITLRYFNIYGPRQIDSSESGVIAIWLGNIIRNEDLTINGDGKITRDYLYIKDVIRVNLLAAEQDASGEIINIGSGTPISLIDLAKLMLRIANKNNLKINFKDPRPGDILNSYTDILKAKNLLHFEPKYTQESGLKDYFNWYNNTYGTNLGK
ncbi:MAG: GDP-mannose 4,6-dehydratase [Candidatus Hermodarchaeota archaeon]